MPDDPARHGEGRREEDGDRARQEHEDPRWRHRRYRRAEPRPYTGHEEHPAYGGYGDLDPARYGHREAETHRDRFGGAMSVREAGDHGDIYDEPRQRGGWSGASRGEPDFGAGYGASGFNRPDRWGSVGPGQHRVREDDYIPGPHRGRGPRNYRRADSRILEDVNDHLTEDPHLDATDIEVTVTSGEVALNGTVDSRAARRRAEDIAEQVSGVTYVQNNIRIRPAAERR